jgi:hypothetical protein
MNPIRIRRLFGITALCAIAALLFTGFFQINKQGPFGDINPFGEDPYDAVGSFAFQAALLVGVLTFARALRQSKDPQLAGVGGRLILRGNGFVLAAIGLTLLADSVAVIRQPVAASGWGGVLLTELAAMILLAAFCVFALMRFWLSVPTSPPPCDLTPADAIDDLWTLVRVPVQILGRFLPRRIAEWTGRMNSDKLFSRAGWINPRSHPWRFAVAVGLLVGVLINLAQLREGLPPSLAIGILVTGIFFFGEFFALLAGFALVGGFLGLRPPIIFKKEKS